MTPKEKAEELVDKMYGITDYQAKQSALIAVDELIEEMCFMWGHYANVEFESEERQEYWQEVKTEIEKL